jgi:hypothetical protein
MSQQPADAGVGGRLWRNCEALAKDEGRRLARLVCLSP